MQELKTFADFDFYLVGTAGFVAAMENILLDNHVKRECIMVDDFG